MNLNPLQRHFESICRTWAVLESMTRPVPGAKYHDDELVSPDDELDGEACEPLWMPDAGGPGSPVVYDTPRSWQRIFDGCLFVNPPPIAVAPALRPGWREAYLRGHFNGIPPLPNQATPNREQEAWEKANPGCPGGRTASQPAMPPYVEVFAPAPLTWPGWAIPAILDVLTAHGPVQALNGEVWCCNHGDGMDHDDNVFEDWTAWREHAAPIIAQRVGCDPKRAIAALQTYSP